MNIQATELADHLPPVHLDRRRRAVLSAIARHDGRYGRTRWAEMLAGEPTGPVRGAGLHLEPEFGLLGRGGLRAAHALLDDLERADQIQTIWPRASYALLELTHAGRAATGLPPLPRPAATPALATPRDRATFDALVARRNELAARTGRLPSEIARLRDLRTLVLARPRTLEDAATHLAPDTARELAPALFGAPPELAVALRPAAASPAARSAAHRSEPPAGGPLLEAPPLRWAP